MKFTGRVTNGKGIDSKRKDWDIVKDYFGNKIFKGTLNVKLNKRFETKKLSCEFKIFDWFGVTKGLFIYKNVTKQVYIGYNFNSNYVFTFFIISDVKLRDELKLEDGDTVEVIL